MGHEVTPTSVETVVEPIASTTSATHEEEGRFLPGTLLGGRYRIIGLLGRGGMGEVYRATDLTLGQSVALKFLPEEASRNQRLLERFHGEVRVARLVSHPNVCRVYDIGEVEGSPFISMEYVDGEDLSSLLPRIGRLPADRALDVSRKLCAGLAAAHDRGVIHRDLKPQNIMMNKRGEVIIMDFGLAAIADQLSGAEVRNGTPAYMAPEQLKGAAVTARSDIYALGLVIYELYTGKRPFDAENVQQLLDRQESLHLLSMTSVAADIDPRVEKVIRRCLDPDPARRPTGALAVSAALPGGDQLAVALAAGETPSPEMVASAGKTEGLERRYSLPCLLFIVLALVGSIVARQKISAVLRTAPDDSPDVLAHQSRTLATSFGYTDKPADSAIWLEGRGPLISYLKNIPGTKKYDEWLAAEAPFRSIYRESPNVLYGSPYGNIDVNNPAPTTPGMVMVSLDGHGRLLTFSAVPYAPGHQPVQPIEPEVVFRAAGLDMAAFSATEPNLLPPSASDQVRAWKGQHPKLPNTELIVQIATWKGQITQAAVEYPWSRPGGSPGQPSTLAAKVRDGFVLFSKILASFVVVLMARRNWKRGRGDRKGALRLAAAQFVLLGVYWAGWTHPVPNDGMINYLMSESGEWLVQAAMTWLVYLALEPEVRARWPQSMVTWTRLLGGRWKDAQVGAHILVGAAVGCAMWVGGETLIDWVGSSKDTLGIGVNFTYLLGARHWFGEHAIKMSEALSIGLRLFLAMFGFRFMVRKDYLAAMLAGVLFTMNEGGVLRSDNWQYLALIYVGLYGALAFALLRYGLLSTVAAIFFVNSVESISIGGAWNAWYAPAGWASMVLLLGIAGFAFWRSLGTRELLGGDAKSELRSATYG